MKITTLWITAISLTVYSLAGSAEVLNVDLSGQFSILGSGEVSGSVIFDPGASSERQFEAVDMTVSGGDFVVPGVSTQYLEGQLFDTGFDSENPADDFTLWRASDLTDDSLEGDRLLFIDFSFFEGGFSDQGGTALALEFVCQVPDCTNFNPTSIQRIGIVYYNVRSADAVGSFEEDLRSAPRWVGGFPQGWIYGWNGGGDVSAQDTFQWLLPTGDLSRLYDTDGIAGIPDSPPGSYTFLGWVGANPTRAGGHPGQGSEQSDHERFVMALFYIPKPGLYEIRRSLLEPIGVQPQFSDGLSYFAGVVGYPMDVVGTVVPTETASFDTALGYHTTGEFVIVGIGSRGNDSYDSFAMDFDVVEAARSVTIDIKPGSDPNCFNQNGRGVIPVAILGDISLDVTVIDTSSLSFSGLDVRVKGNAQPQCGVEDVNRDGYWDLVCQFADDSAKWALGNGEAILRGELYNGINIEGSEAICLVP
jgi:hypothetical protein